MGVLRKRFWIGIVTTLLAIAAAVALLTTHTPQYVASADLLLGGQAGLDRGSSDLLEERALSDSAIQGELAILKSSALLVRVVRRLELDKDPEFNAALRPQTNEVSLFDTAKDYVKALIFPPKPVDETAVVPQSEGVAEAAAARDAMLGGLDGPVSVLRRNMDVRQRGNSFVVSVTLSSEDRIKAAGIANTIVDEYIDFVSDKRFEAAQRFTSWLEMRVEELAQSVEESETAVISFQAYADSEVDSAARIEQQMQEMTTKLVNARTELAETQALAAQSAALFEAEGPIAAAGLLSSPVLDGYKQQLADLRRAEAEAAPRFSEGSAPMDAIRRDLATVEAELEREVSQIITELENQADVQRINVVAIRNSLNGLELIVRARSKEQIKLNQLERVADANRRLYEDFLGRFKEASEIQNLRRADAEVISYASPPSTPATPRKKTTLVLATAAGMFVGLGIIFLLELLPKRFTSSTQVTQRTGLKVFGLMPRMPNGGTTRDLARRLRGSGGRSLRQTALNTARNLELGLGRPAQSVMVMSDLPGADKTTMAMLLGWAAAQQGRSCLIVDADVQNAVLSRRFMADKGPGLLDVLYDEALIDESIRFDRALGVAILPTATTGMPPATFFGTDRANALFRDLAGQFDLVIVDAPAAGTVSDLVSFPDGVDVGLYTMRARRTGVKPVVERMPLFRSVQMKIAGAVMTGVRGRAAAGGGAQRVQAPTPGKATRPA
ncbi:GumC family protein [Marinibacterium sp. SX1]|uniref:GumC family protein n=1 Tax=Marinibacterium sp. SX1 TaxID=3388424 RepID=UPI003D166148